MFGRNKKIKKGWYGQSKRHRLAAKGIKTGRKNIFKYRTNVGHYNNLLRMHDPDASELANVKMMRPGKYIKESKKFDEEQGFRLEKPPKETISSTKAAMQSGRRMTLPFLDYGRKKHDDIVKPIVAKELKNKKIPVVVIKPPDPHKVSKDKRLGYE